MRLRSAAREYARTRKDFIETTKTTVVPRVLYSQAMQANRQDLIWLHIACLNRMYLIAHSVLMKFGPDMDNTEAVAKFITIVAQRTLDDIQYRGIYDRAETQLVHIPSPEIREYANQVFPAKSQFINNTKRAVMTAVSCFQR